MFSHLELRTLSIDTETVKMKKFSVLFSRSSELMGD